MFSLFSRRKSRDEPNGRFSRVTDEAWLGLLVRSINEPVIDGVRMPRFPDDMLQTNTVGAAGEHTLREASMSLLGHQEGTARSSAGHSTLPLAFWTLVADGEEFCGSS